MPKLYQLLETKNKKEQEKRVETLLAIAKAETAVITIVIQGGTANFGLIGRPDPQMLIQALDVVRDDILMAMAKQQAQQEGDQSEGGPPEAKDYKDKEPEEPELTADQEESLQQTMG